MIPQAPSLRAFVGGMLPSELARGVGRFQADLRAAPGGESVRWTKPDHLHLTLRFLGQIRADQTAEIAQRLQQACQGFGPIRLQLGGLGCFPNSHRPRVVWMELLGAVDKMATLQQSIAESLSGLGDHMEEQAFRPHLTIGRVRPDSRSARQVGQLVREATIPSLGAWDLASILLVRSELSPQGAHYTVLADHALARALERFE